MIDKRKAVRQVDPFLLEDHSFYFLASIGRGLAIRRGAAVRFKNDVFDSAAFVGVHNNFEIEVFQNVISADRAISGGIGGN